MTARWEIGSLYHKSFPSVWRDDISMGLSGKGPSEAGE